MKSVMVHASMPGPLQRRQDQAAISSLGSVNFGEDR